jgi:transposase InsO family protein/transposase-like protein
MYSPEERKRAVDLFIKYDKCASDVVHELGYPTRQSLYTWYKEYIEELRTGIIRPANGKHSKFSTEQKQTAVAYYLEHGRCAARVTRALGYPSKTIMGEWVNEFAPGMKKQRRSGVQLTQEQKKAAVIDLCVGRGTAKEIAETYGTRPVRLREWKKDLLGEDVMLPMVDKKKDMLPDDREALLSEVESLKAKVSRLTLEVDILEGTAELLKKDPGVDPANLTNKEKRILIDALRSRYPLSTLLDPLEMAKSSYFYQRQIAKQPDKHADKRVQIVDLFNENDGRYGYRRIHARLTRTGDTVSEKIVLRIMKEEGCEVVTRKRRKYNSYIGEVTPAVPNVLERDFHAEKPNLKWLTDITEFHIPAGKVYLSPIVDCFDGMAVSWTISTSPDAELVNEMLDLATTTLTDDECPVVHSDRGAHYRWPGWISRMDQRGLTRSMSKKGCSPDNSACEGFFGRLKNEMFYNRSWMGVSIDAFIEYLNDYISWYNEVRIKMSLGAMSPLEYRRSLGIAA